MRYLDDILFLFGILCIVAAAFGVDWRLGFLALGAGLLVAGVFVGRYLSAHPEILTAAETRAGERALKRREKRGEGR